MFLLLTPDWEVETENQQTWNQRDLFRRIGKDGGSSSVAPLPSLSSATRRIQQKLKYNGTLKDLHWKNKWALVM